MKKTIAVVLLALLIGGAGRYAWVTYQNHVVDAGLLSRLVTMEQQLTQTKKELIGYTTYTDYLAVTKSAMSEQSKFLAAKVDREFAQVEHVNRNPIKGINFNATIILKYAVEYSVGYDLKSDNFSISGDANAITLRLPKPQLVASPAVKMVSHEIARTDLFIDEKEAVIKLQQQLQDVAMGKSKTIVDDPAVIALCEKSLSAFLRDFLAKQPNVRVIPVIKFVYI
jgi:hypothetical protein